MKFLRSRRGLAAVAVLLLTLFLFRPGVRELRDRIAGSIGSALGRRVTLDNVRIHVLPRPGFDLEGLVVFDDPSFSAEPMVRAQDVSAAVRLRSLFRGRLEIATLSAAEPSINIVRNNEGRWNLASLLERSAQIPAAPTGKRGSEPRPAFPYLQATNARINFKIAQAKKSWALTDADVVLWQENENSWGARMKAQPVRTDFNLSDTGTIQVEATWQRATSLGDTPMQVSVQWRNGQLGQLTKLFSGGDRGWRGGVSLSANLSGTPKSLLIHSKLSIEEFRRYDILSTGVPLSTDCDGRYSTIDGILRELSCESRASGGALHLRGSVGPIRSNSAWDLSFVADKVPLASVLLLARQSKKSLPPDIAASGQVNAEFHAVRLISGATQLTGGGTATDVRISSNTGKEELLFGSIPLKMRDADGKPARPSHELLQITGDESPEAHLLIGPFPLAMGAPATTSAGGWISLSGYRFSLRGDSDINNLYRLTNTLGLSGFHPIAKGSARLDVSVSGVWQGFSAPQATGTAQLHNVRAGMRGLNPVIEIASVTVDLDAENVSLQNIDAQVGDTRWTGSVKAPRPCPPETCIFQFDLAADRLASDSFAEWFAPRSAKRPWYRILTGGEPQGKSPLLGLHARGRLRVDELSLKTVDVSQVTAQVNLDHGKIGLTGVRGQLFEGSHQGNWTIDVSAMPPHYQINGELHNVSMAQVSAVMSDTLATGSADAKFALTTSGTNFDDLLAHCEGESNVTLRNGTFPRLELPEVPKPFPVHLFTGKLMMKGGSWKLNAKLESHDGMYQVAGTATPAGGLNINLTRGDDKSWNITGSLLKPQVTHASTEARTAIKP